jgi:hypothetical protein
MADLGTLHPAEHRAYRELHASCRQLVHRWARLVGPLEGTPAGDALQRGLDDTRALLEELERRTAAYGLHGRPTAQGLGARIADLRALVTDRGADTGLVLRFCVLDMEHLTTLLRHLAELARVRDDQDQAAFCERWSSRLEPDLDAVREAAVDLGTDPDRAAAPLSGSAANRAAHGIGWVFGSIGEAVDRIAGRLRR